MARAALALALARGHRDRRRAATRETSTCSFKGGVGDYTGGLGDLTSTGPTWGATLNVQPYHFLGFELGYEGSQNDVDDIRLPRRDRPPSSAMAAAPPEGLPALPRVHPPLRGRGAGHVLRGRARGGAEASTSWT